MIVTVWVVADTYLAKTPRDMGLAPDGDFVSSSTVAVTSASARPLAGRKLWSNLQFVTLASGMALGLFAQIGLIAHLYSLLVPALGAQFAGVAAGTATAAAIAGRTIVGWLMPVGADRRLFACASTTVQILGSLMFWLAAGDNVPLLLCGVVLFGAGIGNTTSLPPLIAQVEFTGDDVPRVVPLIIAIGQATYALAPAAFGLVREFAPPSQLFVTAAVIQALSIVAFLSGRRR
jgi:hypothetical protein